MTRPVLLVLAGVNGAGKSSVGGAMLQAQHLHWFNPDEFARRWMQVARTTPEQANSIAWREGLRRLDEAIERGVSFAFETTLGGRTMTARLRDASATHDVEVWYCGLGSVEQHIARVQQRVAFGGHDIPEAAIRARYAAAPRNLVRLLPHLSFLRVYDNGADVPPGAPVPDPVMVMEVDAGRVVRPRADDATALEAVPSWARPLVQAAFDQSTPRR